MDCVCICLWSSEGEEAIHPSLPPSLPPSVVPDCPFSSLLSPARSPLLSLSRNTRTPQKRAVTLPPANKRSAHALHLSTRHPQKQAQSLSPSSLSLPLPLSSLHTSQPLSCSCLLSCYIQSTPLLDRPSSSAHRPTHLPYPPQARPPVKRPLTPTPASPPTQASHAHHGSQLPRWS